MNVDAALTIPSLDAVASTASEIEATGYDGIFTFEGQHDPFFPLLLAAEHTERVQLTTAVAIAFARNPMTLAQTAYDLQLASHGRFRLGLGTQIKPHIEKRFSMPWSQPVERDARARARDPRDLGDVARGRAARLPRRVLPAHADDAVLQPRAEPLRPARASSSPAWGRA